MKRTITTLVMGLLVGTAVTAQSQYPVLTIDSAQYVNPSKLATNANIPDYVNPVFKDSVYRDTVAVEGYVSFDPKFYGLATTYGSRIAFFLQKDTFYTPFGGIEVQLASANQTNRDAVQLYQNIQPGLKVKVYGRLGEFPTNTNGGMTQLVLLTAYPTEVVSLSPKTMVPQPVTIDMFMKSDGAGGQLVQTETGEPYEGSLVQFNNVTVVDVDTTSQAAYSIWNIQDDNGNKMAIQGYSGWFRNHTQDSSHLTTQKFIPPASGTKIAYLRGQIVEVVRSGGIRTYCISPRDRNDVGPVTGNAPAITNVRRNPVVANSSNPVAVSARITDDGGVTDAWLYYAVGASATAYDSVQMSLSGTPTDYTATANVPAQANLSFVKYYIRAIDNAGDESRFPNGVGAFNLYRVVDNFNKIQYIQETPFTNGACIWNRDTLTNLDIRAIVTATTQTGDLTYVTLQDGTGPWSGIFVNTRTGDGTSAWNRGDSVHITTAIVQERINQGGNTFGNIGNVGTTFLDYLGGGNSTVLNSGNTLPTPLTSLIIDTLVKGSSVTPYAEPYEGMLVEFDSVYVISTNPDAPSNFGIFTVNQDQTATAGLYIDDDSGDINQTFNVDSTEVGILMSFIRGPLVYTYGNWKLLPRNRQDIDRSNLPDKVKPVITLVGSSPLNRFLNEPLNDPGATALDNKDGNITANIVVTTNYDSSTVGAYTVRYDVMDAAGNKADSVIRIVNVIPSGLAEQSAISNAYLQPNPAADLAQLVWEARQSGTAIIELMDISGRVVLSQQLNVSRGNQRQELQLQGLGAGTYLVKISLGGSSSTTRLVIAN